MIQQEHLPGFKDKERIIGLEKDIVVLAQTSGNSLVVTDKRKPPMPGRSRSPYRIGNNDDPAFGHKSRVLQESGIDVTIINRLRVVELVCERVLGSGIAKVAGEIGLTDLLQQAPEIAPSRCLARQRYRV